MERILTFCSPLLLILGVANAPPALALTAFSGVSVQASAAGCLDSTCGFEFLVNQDMTVTALGAFDANGSGISGNPIVEIGLWRTSGALLTSSLSPNLPAASSWERAS